MTREEINLLNKKKLAKARRSKDPFISNMAKIEWDCRYKYNKIGRAILGGCTGTYGE